MAALRKRVGDAGSVRLEAGPPELAGGASVASAGPAARLAEELKEAFDPESILPAIPEAR